MNSKQSQALILPFLALIAIPAFLLFNFRTMRFEVFFFDIFLGSVLCLAGLAILAVTTNALHKIGEGTIAPWDPTLNLVTSGLYAYVRNPMIGGATLVLAGEAMIFGSAEILVWSFFFFILNSFYFKFIEEPALEERFGEKYRDYKKNVPMWAPRKEPWKKDGEAEK
ncbi:MAG: isoprenylcysteine carboxylmethyltransferase family protein [Candidatus Paceibacterota bacterium]|jgi:protein-S-isoprenylcysteine O-methyltransferase Ste14